MGRRFNENAEWVKTFGLHETALYKIIFLINKPDIKYFLCDVKKLQNSQEIF